MHALVSTLKWQKVLCCFCVCLFLDLCLVYKSHPFSNLSAERTLSSLQNSYLSPVLSLRFTLRMVIRAV
jgi:hypothetical protein